VREYNTKQTRQRQDTDIKRVLWENLQKRRRLFQKKTHRDDDDDDDDTQTSYRNERTNKQTHKPHINPNTKPVPHNEC
jgi:hypothetical protein